MSYSIVKTTPQAVFIIDNDDGMSITNLAETVTMDLGTSFPGLRIIYRDTSGYWDELVHENGEFMRFKFLNHTKSTPPDI